MNKNAAQSLEELDELIRSTLTLTDKRIMGCIIEHGNEPGVTAAQILEILDSNSGIRKSQLYERLKHLASFGFLKVNEFNRPRKYSVSKATIHTGLKNWLDKQRSIMRDWVREVERFDSILSGTPEENLFYCLNEEYLLHTGNRGHE